MMDPQILEIIKALLQRATAGGPSPGLTNFPQINGQAPPPPPNLPPLLPPALP